MVSIEGRHGTYMHAMLKIGMSAILEFRLMFRPFIRKTGNIAKAKSQAAKMADMVYVKAMMMSMLMHLPASPKARPQKYRTGLHWKAVKSPNMQPASTLVNTTMWTIQRKVLLVKGVIRRRDRPTEIFAPIMVRQ
jgi:hypothetical protein